MLKLCFNRASRAQTEAEQATRAVFFGSVHPSALICTHLHLLAPFRTNLHVLAPTCTILHIFAGCPLALKKCRSLCRWARR